MILFPSLELCVYGLNNHENIEDKKQGIFLESQGIRVW